MKFVSVIFTLLVLCAEPVGAQTGSRVQLRTFFSTVLNVTKSYNIYLPAGYSESTANYPVVYFLRLHESEWFNPNLQGRNGTSLKEVADALIDSGQIGPMILVGPSTGSNDGAVAGLFNMLRPGLSRTLGIGSGRFEDYFIEELIPLIDSTYRTIPDRAHRGVDGYSFGGYTSLVLSLRNPSIFSSVGSYDGITMWANLDDPAISGSAPDDPFWLSSTYDTSVGPLFDIPRNIEYMLQHSALGILSAADSVQLESIRSMRFHIHTGYSDSVANRSRNIQLVDSMAAKGIFNTFPDITLASNAVHTFGFADLHASRSLIKHWNTFQQAGPVRNEPEVLPARIELFPNYPNPFNLSTNILYQLDKTSQVELTVHSILGEKIRSLVQATQPAGRYQVMWDGMNDENQAAASGMYLLTFSAGAFNRTRALHLIR